MSDLSFHLLHTKLLQPQLAPSLAPRPRLLDKLLDRPDATLLLLVASDTPISSAALFEAMRDQYAAAL